MHTHANAGLPVACMQGGLPYTSVYPAQIAQHGCVSSVRGYDGPRTYSKCRSHRRFVRGKI
ncbi:hypothetical protein ACMX25_13320 [Caballeronia sp. 15715]|uniref:hypothetical protein n=1 Tax=Caballeronia sp. 15715 TaxID=3391030 RepID=UPI0039E26280